jgi:hypothetical protein
LNNTFVYCQPAGGSIQGYFTSAGISFCISQKLGPSKSSSACGTAGTCAPLAHSNPLEGVTVKIQRYRSRAGVPFSFKCRRPSIAEIRFDEKTVKLISAPRLLQLYVDQFQKMRPSLEIAEGGALELGRFIDLRGSLWICSARCPYIIFSGKYARPISTLNFRHQITTLSY